MTRDELIEKLIKDAKAAGYFMSPDQELLEMLADGLLVNQARYGYQACPCRLASGDKEEDLDIVCPCDYRDADLAKYGACFCGLYVSQEISEGKKKFSSIPETRLVKEERDAATVKKQMQPEVLGPGSLPYPVWRCKVCGYLCASEKPPGLCPICKAQRERFERFM